MFHVPEKFRASFIGTQLERSAEDGNNGAFILVGPYGTLKAIASDGAGWEHVSVSTRDRVPTWQQMCWVKDLFWDAEDAVIQFHPPKSEYVNCHPYTLHLWRPVGIGFPRPPYILVGPMPSPHRNI